MGNLVLWLRCWTRLVGPQCSCWAPLGVIPPQGPEPHHQQNPRLCHCSGILHAARSWGTAWISAFRAQTSGTSSLWLGTFCGVEPLLNSAAGEETLPEEPRAVQRCKVVEGCVCGRTWRCVQPWIRTFIHQCLVCCVGGGAGCR